ncbi:MAG: hypothetical protein IJ600_12785 [Lachnospiraceae bacterium]|nr:hypothetical protein [Lachnospiraceae bacterium]
MIDITMASNCYYKNYELVTSEEWIKRLLLYDNDCIAHRTLFVSNIDDRKPVIDRLTCLRLGGVINDYFFSYDYFDEIERRFRNCSRESFYRRTSIKEFLDGLKRGEILKLKYDGLLYSISQICAILKCKTKYILYVTEDVIMDNKTLEGFIKESISVMNNNPKVLVANPIWNNAVKEAKNESFREDDNFWYSYGFSDQCCLLDVEKIHSMTDIFAEKNSFTEKAYPYYSANCFERRMSAYMRNHGFERITYKNASYTHKKI